MTSVDTATVATVDDEWSSYLLSMKQSTNLTLNNISNLLNKDIELATTTANDASSIPPPPPICTHLNISTQTKVLFLNKTLDIEDIYWKIPILDYWRPECGVLKKTVKIVSLTKEAVAALENRLRTIPCYKEDIIKQIDVQSTSRSKFKDERKITIGICKKDIMACRIKKKNVFYNCFSLVIRIGLENNDSSCIIQDATKPSAREIHVKIFNTGKMEIPGILNNEIFVQSREIILKVLRPLIGDDCDYIDGSSGANIPNYVPSSSVNVLINSNFNVGFFINREKLHHILRSEKYNLNSSYDPCTYPGVKCKFYYNHNLGLDSAEKQNGVIADKHSKMKTIISEKTYIEISIMIFRTGSGLIVGNCSEQVLNYVFEFIARILHNEYHSIYIAKSTPVAKQKTTKIRRKMIHVLHQNEETTVAEP